MVNETRIYVNDTVKVIVTVPKDVTKNVTIEIFDCKKIADEIYDYCVERSALFNALGNYLPDFKRDMERETYFGNVQKQGSNYINPESIYEQLVNHIHNNPISVISGISGAGKTEISIYYARNNKDNYENVFWLTGKDFKSNPIMDNYKRGGVSINLVSIFNVIKSLIVIDNYDKIICENDFSDFKQGFSIGSRILITSLNTGNNSLYFKIPRFPEDCSLKILGDASEEAKSLLDKINIPVVLTAIKSICDCGECSYKEIYSDIKPILQSLTDDDNKVILERVLNKYPYVDLLKRLCCTLNATFDIQLLKKYINISQFINLQKSSFLIECNNRDTCTFHSFIISCLRDKDESKDFITFISKYLDNKSGLIDEYILRQIHLSYGEIKEIVIKEPEKLNWITYALLQKEENKDKKNIYRTLYTHKFTKGLSFEKIRCLLDIKEAYSYDAPDQDDYLMSYEKELEKAMTIYYENDKALKLIYHHLGKNKRRQKKYIEAVDLFNKELKIDNHSFPAYEQIIKCAKSDRSLIKNSKTAIEQIISAIKGDDEQLPIRIALAFISDLRSFEDYVTIENADDFKKIIIKASYDEMYQFYEAFVSFVNFYYYKDAEICLDLYNRLTNLKFITIDKINEKNYANVLDAFSIIYGLLENDDSRKAYISQLVCDIIDDLKNSVKPYDIRSVLKAYNKLSMYSEADSLIINDNIRNDIWILLWKAKAKIGLNDIKCLDLINDAITQKIPDKFKSTFFQCQAKAYIINKKLDEAKKSYSEAINACKNMKFKEELQKELEDICN